MVKFRMAEKRDIDKLCKFYLEMINAENKIIAKTNRGSIEKIPVKSEEQLKESILKIIKDFYNCLFIAIKKGEIVGCARGHIFCYTNPSFPAFKEMGSIRYFVIKKDKGWEKIADELYYTIDQCHLQKNDSLIRLEVWSDNPVIELYENWGLFKLVSKLVK